MTIQLLILLISKVTKVISYILLSITGKGLNKLFVQRLKSDMSEGKSDCRTIVFLNYYGNTQTSSQVRKFRSSANSSLDS